MTTASATGAIIGYMVTVSKDALASIKEAVPDTFNLIHSLCERRVVHANGSISFYFSKESDAKDISWIVREQTGSLSVVTRTEG